MITIFIVYPYEGMSYIAGVFSSQADADAYLAQQPTDLPPFDTIINEELRYPFFLYEYTKTIQVQQTSVEWDQYPGNLRCTIYRVEGDFVPTVPWHDYMGNIPHRHPRDDDLTESPLTD